MLLGKIFLTSILASVWCFLFDIRLGFKQISEFQYDPNIKN